MSSPITSPPQPPSEEHSSKSPGRRRSLVASIRRRTSRLFRHLSSPEAGTDNTPDFSPKPKRSSVGGTGWLRSHSRNRDNKDETCPGSGKIDEKRRLKLGSSSHAEAVEALVEVVTKDGVPYPEPCPLELAYPLPSPAKSLTGRFSVSSRARAFVHSLSGSLRKGREGRIGDEAEYERAESLGGSSFYGDEEQDVGEGVVEGEKNELGPLRKLSDNISRSSSFRIGLQKAVQDILENNFRFEDKQKPDRGNLRSLWTIQSADSTPEEQNSLVREHQSPTAQQEPLIESSLSSVPPTALKVSRLQSHASPTPATDTPASILSSSPSTPPRPRNRLPAGITAKAIIALEEELVRDPSSALEDPFIQGEGEGLDDQMSRCMQGEEASILRRRSSSRHQRREKPTASVVDSNIDTEIGSVDVPEVFGGVDAPPATIPADHQGVVVVVGSMGVQPAKMSTSVEVLDTAPKAAAGVMSRERVEGEGKGEKAHL